MCAVAPRHLAKGAQTPPPFAFPGFQNAARSAPLGHQNKWCPSWCLRLRSGIRRVRGSEARTPGPTQDIHAPLNPTTCSVADRSARHGQRHGKTATQLRSEGALQ